MSAAAAVLDYYCQAAQKKVVATVSQSISETKATSLGQATRPTSNPSSTPQNTGGATGGGGGSSDSKSGGGGGLGKGAIIAIAVLGALVVIGVLAFLAIFIRRRNRKAKAAAADSSAADPSPYPPHSELATNSPSSELDGKSPHAPPAVAEVAATPTPYHQQPHAELAGTAQPPQVHQAVSPSELSSPGSQHGAQRGNSPYDPNQHWQPPAQAMYELDSSTALPHAR